MTREDIIRMASDCGLMMRDEPMHGVERFAEMVAAAERERMKWYGVHSCGPTCDRPACVTVRKAVKAEREACAKVCDEQGKGRKAMEHYAALTYAGAANDCAVAIRAMGEK